MRKLAIAFLLLLCGGNAVFAENEIPLQVQNESSSSKNRPRSITPEVTGDCNGYFTSGIFHTQEAVISDNISENNDNDYWIGFNTITYDNPNQ